MSVTANIHINDFDSIRVVLKEFETFKCIEFTVDGNQIHFFAENGEEADTLVQYFNNYSVRKIKDEE